MANSVHAQLAAAVVDELNDPLRFWAGQFTAVRTSYPTWTGVELESLRVAVVADSLTSKRIARAGSKSQHTFKITVDLQKALSITSSVFQADSDVLDKLAQDIQDFYLDGHALLDAYTVMELERDIYVPEQQGQGIWETMIDLTIMGFR